MSKEPELSIKVSVDPVIDGEKLKSDIQTQVDKVKELPKVSVEVDVDNFSSSLSNKMKDELKDVNKKLKYYLTEIATTSKDLNKAVVNLFADTNFADRIDKQFKKIETSIEDTKKSAISASSYFDDIFNSSSVKNLTEFYSLLDKVGAGMNKLSSVSTNTKQFNSQFKALSEDAQTLYDVLSKFSNKSIDVDFLKKIGIDSEDYNYAVNNITYLMNALNELYNFNGTTESKEKSPIKRLASEIGTDSEEITGVFQDVKADLTDLMKTILDNAEKAEDAKKKLNSSVEVTSGGFDKEKVNKMSQAYLKAMGVLVNQQRILNTTKRSTIELEDNLLAKTKEVSTAIGEEVTSLKSLFNEVSKSDIGKQLPAVSEYMKSKAELEASKNIENAKSLSLNVNSSSAKEYEAALKGIKDRINELGKEGAFDGLNNNIDENERAFINAKEYIKDYASALDEIKSKGRDTRLPQQRTTGLNVSNIENYSQKVTAIKNDLYALKDTVFPAIYSDINRTYGHLFDDSITNVQSYIDKLNEIPAAASSKAPANRAPAKTQHNKNAETIDSTNIKNYATLLNGIQGAMNDMKATIVPGFDEVLDKNGKKINDIGTSLVNYVAVLKRGLKAVDQSEKTMADKTAAKPVAVPTKNNAPVKKPTAQKIQDAKATINSNEIVVTGDPVNIPGKVTLKVEDVTPPKGSVKIPGKVELKVSDITLPKTAVKLDGIPETPNYTKPSEMLDDYRDSVGAAAGIQEYFAKEVDNATAALGSQSETLKALKKSLDEYTSSIDGVKKFAKAEKELDRLKKKLAQQQQQQPAQSAPQQPNNQPLVPIKPNSNPKPHNNGQPPAPPTPPNNQTPNNSGNTGGGSNFPVESQQKLEQALERIMTKMITAQNKKDTSGDKGYGKNVAEQVKWQGQLHDRAEELIDKLNAKYPGWEKGKSWQRHGENIAHVREDYSTAREDKQDLDIVQKLGKELQRNLKLREDLHKIDKNIEPVKYQNTQDDIKKSKAEIARLRSEAKAKGLNTNEVTSDFLRSASELQERLTNKAAAKAKADADDWLDTAKKNINEAKNTYISAQKEIDELDKQATKTHDRQTQADIASEKKLWETKRDNAEKTINGYLVGNADKYATDANKEIDSVLNRADIKNSIAVEKEAATEERKNIAQYEKLLKTKYDLQNKIATAHKNTDTSAWNQQLTDTETEMQNLYQGFNWFAKNEVDLVEDSYKAIASNKDNLAKDKKEADYVREIVSNYKTLTSLENKRFSLFKPDQIDNLRDIDDEIKRINSDLAKTYAEAKQNGYDLIGNSDIQESIDSLSREKKISKRDFAKNQQQYNNAQIENLFDEYERLTSKLQTYGQRRASSIGSDNVQAQSNVLRDYINTQTELNKLESEFKNRGFLKAGSAEWQQTYDLMEKRKDLEKAVEFEVNNRIQAEQEAIRVQDEDRLSLLAYIKTIEKYKDTLEKDSKTDSSVYEKSVGMSNASWDLLNELNKNPDNKDQVAYLWGQKYNIQGVTDLESAFKALAVEAAKAGIEVQDLRTETEKLRAVTQAKTNIANLKSQLIDYLEKFPKVGKALAEPVQKLQEALADPNAYKNAGQLKQAMAELRAQAKSLGLESENLIDKFEKLFGQHLSTMITMAALHKMQDALRIVCKNVVEIDTAVTELRKVSEYAGKSLEEYMGRAAEQAQKLGVSISDYVNSTADWKRLGYSDKDAENLATYSTLLKNVGDNIDDVNTSSSYLISTLQGFGLLADQAEDVVNKIDAVANTQPVTAKDLGEILTRSSAAMSAANNTLEETIALGTAANAVIQDADTVGTTLKSLSMYLRAAKSDAENAGIEVDGMANSVSELRSELKSLTGVDIMLDSKNFKSTYQILKDLSQVWSGLSDVTQANVTEMIGGKRNANAVSAILNNFDVAESAMESAANSANVAWEENEKWLDSIQGRLGQLDASFQVLSQDVLSSGLVKTGVSFLTSIVKLLDKIINLTGALPAGLGIAAFATQLGKPKMTGFMIVPSNTPGGDTEQVLRRYFIISLRSMREYLVKPTNMVA